MGFWSKWLVCLFTSNLTCNASEPFADSEDRLYGKIPVLLELREKYRYINRDPHTFSGQSGDPPKITLGPWAYFDNILIISQFFHSLRGKDTAPVSAGVPFPNFEPWFSGEPQESACGATKYSQKTLPSCTMYWIVALTESHSQWPSRSRESSVWCIKL